MGSTKDGIDRGFASVLRWREGERDILVQEMRLIESKIHTITSQRTQREKMLVELQHVAFAQGRRVIGSTFAGAAPI